MKTGRLELLKFTDGYLISVLDEEGYPVKCESHKRMEELEEKYKDQLEEGEYFTVKQNW